jgi:hypothetical protein
MLINAMHASEDPRLLRFLEALFFSSAILNKQYLQISSIQKNLHPNDGEKLLEAIALIWGIVDTIHRIRELTEALPGIKGNDPATKNFIATTEITEQFRHYIQHLRGELSRKDIHDFPVWGSFSWVNPLNDKQCYLAITGIMTDGIKYNACVYDRWEDRWVSKTALSIKELSFNTDPMVQVTLEFCKYIVGKIKGTYSGKIASQELPTILRCEMTPNEALITRLPPPSIPRQ